MGSSDLVLGIDCSTTASKAVAWNAAGEIAAEGRAPLELLTPHPGWGEQRATDWREATVSAIRAVTAQVAPERIAAVAITHQRETFVPVAENGRPLRHGILWLDERSRAQLADLAERFGGERLHRLTGRPLSMTQSLPKMLWVVQHEPETILGADRIVEVHAYLVHALTGEWRTSLPSADPTGMVDMARGAWSAEVIEGIGLRMEQFPPFERPGTV
ncbi:MAG: FGGY-family carbohydrate kinase, partial [Chloroflexota bacterium]